MRVEKKEEKKENHVTHTGATQPFTHAIKPGGSGVEEGQPECDRHLEGVHTPPTSVISSV